MKRKKSKKKMIITGTTLLLVVTIVGGVMYLKNGTANVNASSSVVSGTATLGDMRTTIEGSGSLEYGNTEKVTLPTEIEVDEILVNEGDKVQVGTELAKLNSLSVKEAYYKLEETIEDLEDDQADTDDDEAEYYELEQELVDARESLAIVGTMLESNTLLSTIEGEVTYIADLENTATSTTDSRVAYTEVFQIQNDANMVAFLTLDEMDILSVAIGQTVSVTVDALGVLPIEGAISSINYTGSNDGGTTNYSVEVSIPKQENMLSGMSLSASIIVSEQLGILTVPAAAVTVDREGSYVYTSQDSETGELGGKTVVTTGSSDGTNVEIVEGLSEGDSVYYNFEVGEQTDSPMMMMPGMTDGMGKQEGMTRPEGMPSGNTGGRGQNP